MAIRLRDTIFSPLSVGEARALLDEIAALMEAAEPPVPGDGASLDLGNGYSVVPSREPEHRYADLAVFEDVVLALEKSPAALADARALAPSAVEPAALARLPSCHSALTLEYYGHVWKSRAFIALQKLIFARVGEAVVSCGEATDTYDPPKTLKTIATLAAERAAMVGPKWARILRLDGVAPPPKPLKTRPAKAGELEAIKVFKRLARMIEGRDPLARDALKRQLGGTTEAVRAYASALMDDGPRPDLAVAKSLGWAEAEVSTSRAALRELLISRK